MPRQGSDRPGGPPRRRVLVVDDDPTMLLICKRTLLAASPDAEVVLAASGEEAREILAERSFDLVLSDYRMGVVSGTDVLETALAKDPQMVRVLMSGYGDPAMIENARERARIHDFIEKPITTRELEALLVTKVVARLALAGGDDA